MTNIDNNHQQSKFMDDKRIDHDERVRARARRSEYRGYQFRALLIIMFICGALYVALQLFNSVDKNSPVWQNNTNSEDNKWTQKAVDDYYRHHPQNK